MLTTFLDLIILLIHDIWKNIKEKKARAKNVLYPKINSVLHVNHVKMFLKSLLYFHTFWPVSYGSHYSSFENMYFFSNIVEGHLKKYSNMSFTYWFWKNEIVPCVNYGWNTSKCTNSKTLKLRSLTSTAWNQTIHPKPFQGFRVFFFSIENKIQIFCSDLYLQQTVTPAVAPDAMLKNRPQ